MIKKTKGFSELLKSRKKKKIRVRRKSDGRIGYMPESKFNPKKYEKINAK